MIPAFESRFGPIPTKVAPVASYAPPDRFLWDSWIVSDDSYCPPLYRLFHLDAPAGADPEARHDLASVRQAVSADLTHWHDLGTALAAGSPGRWDDKAIWTGSVRRTESGEYRFFYTGRNHQDGQLQRIGLACSKDGIEWRRNEKPLLEPDGRYYETTEESAVYKAWRDPEVIQDHGNGDYLMLFTARTKNGDPRYKGCLGLARSAQLDGPYEACPPLLAPWRYAQMEVPQVIEKNNKVYVFFSTWAGDYEPHWASQIGGGQSGLHAYVADSLGGPFEPVNGDGIVTRTAEDLYTVKLVPDPQRPGEYVALGWYVNDQDGHKALTLSLPMPVSWDSDRIVVHTGG